MLFCVLYDGKLNIFELLGQIKISEDINLGFQEAVIAFMLFSVIL